MSFNRPFFIATISLVTTGSTMFFVGCGGAKYSNESFSYQYVVGTCDTKRHVFANKVSYCKGLQDNSANNGCAFDERRAAFENASCGASFEQPVN